MSDPAPVERVVAPETILQNMDVADLVAKLNEIVAALTAPPPAPTPHAVDAPAASASAGEVSPAAAVVSSHVGTTPEETIPHFKASGDYRASPRALSRAEYSSGGHYNTGLAHMTVFQFAERVAALPDDTTIATGSCLTINIIRSYALHHRSAMEARTRNHDSNECYTDVVVSPPCTVGRDGKFTTWFNAVALSGGPVKAGRLARKLAEYAHDAPDAFVLVGEHPACLPDNISSLPSGAYVPVIEAFPVWEISETALNPYGQGSGRITDLDEIVKRAKCMPGLLSVRQNLGRVASYVASAMTDGGLAALDLFYVPRTTSRAAIKSGASSGSHGELLTLAEFENAHGGRTITEEQIENFYHPVLPSDPSVPYNPMARILAANVDNVADLHALLDDPLLRE